MMTECDYAVELNWYVKMQNDQKKGKRKEQGKRILSQRAIILILIRPLSMQISFFSFLFFDFLS